MMSQTPKHGPIKRFFEEHLTLIDHWPPFRIAQQILLVQSAQSISESIEMTIAITVTVWTQVANLRWLEDFDRVNHLRFSLRFYYTLHYVNHSIFPLKPEVVSQFFRFNRTRSNASGPEVPEVITFSYRVNITPLVFGCYRTLLFHKIGIAQGL
ncbi:hypothetical protein CEXT_773631 [Caerostris extrusa]|uniref:Maturase K n=1 Tax=Caerostris extrusa TaxID=172846 RepID=A0AAV4UDP2_CAEEX|nr:hypothetical protein CEXT_773631 [Caerostris extrusa]